MPALLEVQRALRAVLLGGDPGVQGAWLDGDAAGIDIYRHTIRSALVNALRLSHPAVQRLVGAECFDGAADAFVSTQLPGSADLNGYGAPFAGFLQQFGPVAGLDYLADVARLDWAVHCALHAPDAPALDLGRLAALDAGTVPDLKLRPHPSMVMLYTDCAADAIWRAVLTGDEAALGALDPASGPARLRVWRDDTGIDVVRLPAPEWEMLRRLVEGQPLHAALAGLDAPQAQAALARELAAGRFIDFQ